MPGKEGGQQAPHMGLCSFVIALGEMWQVHSGAAGIRWWGPSWRLVTCGPLEAQLLHGEGVSLQTQAQASSGSMWSPREGPGPCLWTDFAFRFPMGDTWWLRLALA